MDRGARQLRQLPTFLQRLQGGNGVDGLYAVDTGFQRDRFDAAFLVVDEGRAAFIDTGTNHAVPRLLAVLDALDLARDSVDWVIPTHVHLDHAGGVGLLMQSLPRARVLVHPRGLRHLVDPGVLYQGAMAVYGQQEMDNSYGQLVSVDATRVQASNDGQPVRVGRRELVVVHTPGHARHHHCIWDAASRGWFTGDTFGLSYREFDVDGRPWMAATSTPVQFEPEVLKASIARLMSFEPEVMYLTHFSAVSDVPRLARLLVTQLDDMVAASVRLRRAPARHAALMEAVRAIFLRSLRAHGCTLPDERVAELLALDIELNAQGLAIWLDKQPA